MKRQEKKRKTLINVCQRNRKAFSTEKSFLYWNWQPDGLSIYLLHRKRSVRQAASNNKLQIAPQTSTVFYLAGRNYSSAQSICNWHRLNKKLQPLKALFIISCKSADLTVSYSDGGPQTVNTVHRVTRASLKGGLPEASARSPFSRQPSTPGQPSSLVSGTAPPPPGLAEALRPRLVAERCGGHASHCLGTTGLTQLAATLLQFCSECILLIKMEITRLISES